MVSALNLVFLSSEDKTRRRRLDGNSHHLVHTHFRKMKNVFLFASMIFCVRNITH